MIIFGLEISYKKTAFSGVNFEFSNFEQFSPVSVRVLRQILDKILRSKKKSRKKYRKYLIFLRNSFDKFRGPKTDKKMYKKSFKAVNFYAL